MWQHGGEEQVVRRERRGGVGRAELMEVGCGWEGFILNGYVHFVEVGLQCIIVDCVLV